MLRAAQHCFEQGQDPSIILLAADPSSPSSQFYAQLYLSLWHEAFDQPDLARTAMLNAVQTPYAKSAGDYMTAVARVHCKVRGWTDCQKIVP